MKYRNAFIFIAAIACAPALVLGGLFAWDATLLAADPSANTTISVEFSDLCYRYPAIPSFLCLWVGFVGGLVPMFVAHTMWNVGTPEMRAAAAKVDAYASRVTHLESVAAGRLRDLASERLARNAAEKRVDDLQLRLSDCLTGQKAYPRIADTPEA